MSPKGTKTKKWMDLNYGDYENMNYADLENYIKSETPESVQLDYIEAKHKFTSSDKQENVAKIVCAMANSGGGMIIYGMETLKRGKFEIPTAITGIDENNISAINDIIKDMIKPAILNCIPGTPIKNASGNLVAYVVKVPDSEFIPHQSLYNHVFYGRIGDNSQALDYTAVERLFNTQRKRLENIPIIIIDCIGGSLNDMRFKIRNVGNTPAINIKIKLNTALIIQSQCLSSNLFLDSGANISGIPQHLNAPEYIIGYQDISGALYEIIIQGNYQGAWYQPKPAISRLSRNGKILIGS